MIAGLFGLLALLLALALAYLVTLYSRAKVQLHRMTAERDSYQAAVHTARGFLLHASTIQLPGVSDAAVRALDDINKKVPK